MLFLPLGCLLTSLMTPFDQQMFLILVWFGLLLFFLCWVLFMCDLRNLCLSQGPGGRLLCDFGGFVFYCSHLDRRSLWSWLAGGRARPVFCWLRTLRFQALADWLPPSHGAVAALLSHVTCAGGRRSVSLAAVLPFPSLWPSPEPRHRAAEVPQLCCSSGCLSCCWPLHL